MVADPPMALKEQQSSMCQIEACGTMWHYILHMERTMYPAVSSQVLQFVKATRMAWAAVRWRLSSVLISTSSLLRRFTASSRSSSERYRVVVGKLGRTKVAMMAQLMVATPSTICARCQLLHVFRGGKALCPLTKSQRQPAMPWAPSRLPVMAPDTMPPNAPESTAAE